MSSESSPADGATALLLAILASTCIILTSTLLGCMVKEPEGSERIALPVGRVVQNCMAQSPPSSPLPNPKPTMHIRDVRGFDLFMLEALGLDSVAGTAGAAQLDAGMEGWGEGVAGFLGAANPLRLLVCHPRTGFFHCNVGWGGG